MGLDISFNREQAIAAGLQLNMLARSTEEEIAEALQGPYAEDKDYIQYLQRVEEVVHIPGTEYVAENGGVDTIVIRANKWGSIYGPITSWLRSHNIEWSEF